MNTDQRATAAEEVNKARKELDKAREELNSFKADNPKAFFDIEKKEYFTFLTQQVEKREAALKDRAAELIALAQIEREERGQNNSKKRKAASMTSRSSGGELNQDSFRKRLLDRDIECVLTGRGKLECDACHIVPWVYFQRHDLIGKKVFDIVFPFSCDNPEYRIMDVRNGILMWHVLHNSFDKFDFTIIKIRGIYTVKTLEEHEFEEGMDKELLKTVFGLNGKNITFNTDRQNEWPGDKFLKFHNECFDARRVAFRAAAEEYPDNEYDETLAESIKKSKVWLEQTVNRIQV